MYVCTRIALQCGGGDASFYREFNGVDGSVDKVFAPLPFSVYLTVWGSKSAASNFTHTHTQISGGWENRVGKNSNKCACDTLLHLRVEKHWNACRALKLSDTIPKSSKEINKESNLKRGQARRVESSLVCPFPQQTKAIYLMVILYGYKTILAKGESAVVAAENAGQRQVSRQLFPRHRFQGEPRNFSCHNAHSAIPFCSLYGKCHCLN